MKIIHHGKKKCIRLRFTAVSLSWAGWLPLDGWFNVEGVSHVTTWLLQLFTITNQEQRLNKNQ